VHGFPGTQQQQQNQPPQLQRSLSFQSDEGFGDPLGRPSSLTDVRDMLHLIGAKPGQHLTQMIMVSGSHISSRVERMSAGYSTQTGACV
jgi:hypothetical protein